LADRRRAAPSRSLQGLRCAGGRRAAGGALRRLRDPLFRPWIDDSRASISVPDHRRLIRELADLAAAERLPTVVAGDLNLVDRSSGYRLLDDRMRDAVRTSWAGPTSLKGKFLPLLARIDHIFVSEEWCADGGGRFDIAGSDHRGVVATIGPCRHGGRAVTCEAGGGAAPTIEAGRRG
jgi:hypothetical protein